MIRGDEAYATSTDTLLTLVTDSSQTPSPKGEKVGFKYNVLRDVGESTVSLYDGEELLDVFDWDDDTGEQTIAVNNGYYLSYGEEHELYMRYNGNSHCLKSKSKIINFKKNIPSSLQTTITFSNTSLSSNTYSFTLALKVGGISTGACVSQPIYIYVDGDEAKTVTTGSGGVVSDSVTVPFGVHTVQAVLHPTDSINEASESITVVNGFKVQIIEAPSYFVNGVDNIVKVLVTNTNDVPQNNKTVTFNGATQTTNSNGIATFTVTNITSGEHSAVYDTNYSDTIDVVLYEPQLTLTAPKNNMVALEDTTTVTAKLNEPYKDIPISIDGTTYYTNNDGEVSIEVEASNQDQTITASVGNESKSITIETVVLYKGIPSSSNVDTSSSVRIMPSSVNETEVSNGYRLETTGSNIRLLTTYFSKWKNTDWQVQIRLAQINKSASLKLYYDTASSPIDVGGAITNTYTIKKNGTTVKVYCLGKLMSTTTVSTWETFELRYVSDSSNLGIILQSLKIKPYN